MQKLIAKYGLAAHLALLAAAPLFLFPFCGDIAIARVLLWISLPAALWTILEPSMHSGEHLHDARRRVARTILRDPLFWASLTLVGFTGFRAINTGIALAYDAEAAAWHVSAAPFPILPGVVDSAGNLPFAASVVLLILLQACRHSLGRSARMAFFLLSSALSGLAAIIALLAIHEGSAGATALLPSPDGFVCSCVGFAFGFHLLCGLVALVALFEHRWSLACLLLPLSIGGTAAGMFAFSPLYLAAAFAALGVLVLAYDCVFVGLTFSSSKLFKAVIFCGTSLAIGGLLVAAILPSAVLTARLDAIAALKAFPDRFWEVRGMLSPISFKSWISHLWIGTGLGSFPLDFRFYAKDADWLLLPSGAALPPNGWWLVLAERGLVGLVFFALPFGFLLFTYVRRLTGWAAGLRVPHPSCLMAPLAFLLFVAAGFFDCSPLRTEVLIVLGAILAVSAAEFPRVKR